MTREQIERIRIDAAIEGELRVIESIPSHHFGGVREPDLLGGQILDECVERIRKVLGGGSREQA